MSAQTRGERAPAQIEGLVKQLLVTRKAVRLYPAASNIPRENAAEVVKILRGVLQSSPTVRLTVTKDGLFYGGLPLLPGRAAFIAFARELYAYHLSDVRFHAGVTAEEVVSFLAILDEPPEEVEASGGFSTRLWDRQVDGITVGEIATKIVDVPPEPTDQEQGASQAPQEAWPPDPALVDSWLASVKGLSPSNRRLLVRFLQSPMLTTRYLEESVVDRAMSAAVNLLGERVSAMAHLAANEVADDQPALYRAIAESIMGLDLELREHLLADRLLGDARIDDTLAEVVRQLDLTDVCMALAEGFAADRISKEGLSRALRNLALISRSAREDLLETARAQMEQAGVAADDSESLLEAVWPVHLRAEAEHKVPEQDDTVLSSVMRLVDFAAAGRLADESDEEIAALRQEAHAGVTDGDVLAALVTLVTLERRPDVFSSMMALVEDSLGMLLEWGEYEIAADATASLMALEGDESLAPAARARVHDAVCTLARPEQMRLIATAMRVFRRGSAEYDACRRLLRILGAHAIEPLLEVLADEPDMLARKALVELISEIAVEHIAALGEHVQDSRWYFVRNVVTILGATRAREALPYLARALRHSDSRVRRETIRALASMRDRYAEELLIAALDDDDAQNVQLASRFLGSTQARGAVPALCAVARGEGRGNRDTGPRVEAIEALGRIGDRAAVPVLTQIAASRGILRSSRSREVRVAAEGALEEIGRSVDGGTGI